MADLQLVRGTTSKAVTVRVQGGSPATAVTGLTGTSLVGFYYREGATNAVALTFVTSGVLGTFATGAFVEIFSSMSAGMYLLGLTNASLSTTATTGTVQYWLTASAGTSPIEFKIQLTEVDLHNGMNAGLSSLATASSGGLLGLPLNGLQIPSAAAGGTSGIAVVGVQIPTGTAGALSGLPVVGVQLGTATMGMTGGLPQVGKQIPSASAGVTGGLVQLGIQIPTASAGFSGGFALVGTQVPTASYGATGLLTGTSYVGVSTLSTSAAGSLADTILDRDMSLGTDSGSPTLRTVRQALRPLRNKIIISTSGTMTVYKEDDLTVSWTGTVLTNSNAVQITGVDPA